MRNLKKRVYALILGAMFISGIMIGSQNVVLGAPPSIDQVESQLKSDGSVLTTRVDKDNTLRQNIFELFYPGEQGNNQIFKVVRDVTLGVMVIFIVMAGASLLINRDSKESNKGLKSLLYIMLGGIFIYIASRLFGSVFNFSGVGGIVDGEEGGIGGVTNKLIGDNSVLFKVLSAVKAAAFFLAIIMIVVTGFKVISAGDGEKGKKLVKGIVNVVVALLVIKGVDFIYYMAADSQNFVKNAADFIINVAKIFGYIYGVIIVLMVIVAGYLYITDGGTGNNFKKASNVLVNILLSGLVLFSFLLILYQVFAEFQTGGDAVRDATAFISQMYA